MANQLSHQATEIANHAKQLSGQAGQLTHHADELSLQAEQLMTQAEVIQAMLQEVYQSKEDIGSIYTKLDFYDKRIAAIENSIGNETISHQEIASLCEAVRQKKVSAKKLWHKFNQHFSISSYKNLAKKDFPQALQWIAQYT
jgi:uncharacterized protein (DUF3084 family)